MNGTQIIRAGENQFKLFCPECKRHKAYAKFQTSTESESGRQAICSSCQNGEVEQDKEEKKCFFCHK